MLFRSIGALYFPAFKSKDFKWVASDTALTVGDSVDFEIVDQDYTGFMTYYQPKYVIWDLKDGTVVDTTDNPYSYEFTTAGKYAVLSTVISHFGFYGYKKTGSVIGVAVDADFEFIITDENGVETDYCYAGRQYYAVFTNTSVVGLHNIGNLYLKYGENSKGSSNDGAVLTNIVGANLKDFQYGGGTLRVPITFHEPYGYSSVTAFVQSLAGSNIVRNKIVFVDIKEDVYYVDLSLEYETTEQWINKATAFYDDFEAGIKPYGWSTSFRNNSQTKDMWSDTVAVTLSNSNTVSLFDSTIGSDMDVEFSFVRSVKDDIPVMVISDGTLSMDIYWDYNADKIYVNELSVSYAYLRLPKNLNCDDSMRSISFRVVTTSNIPKVYFKYNGIGDWIPFPVYMTAFGSTVNMSLYYTKNVGLGYFKGQSSSGFYITNGMDEDHPLTYTQMSDRLQYSAMLYDKYLCRGYRDSAVAVNVSKKVTIDAWNLSEYGPWVICFSVSNNRQSDFSNALLKNGVVYLGTKTGVINVGNTYDMFFTWNSQSASPGSKFVQKELKWKNSKYSASKIIGSTINIKSVT